MIYKYLQRFQQVINTILSTSYIFFLFKYIINIFTKLFTS